MGWNNPLGLRSRPYTCGYCKKFLASEKGYTSSDPYRIIYICHFCDHPTYFDDEQQYPGVSYGEVVNNIPDEGIRLLYKEAGDSYSVGAYTGAVMACRKILMHLAVNLGAEEGLKFVEYVDYLKDQNHILPSSYGWVDQIRSKGNEANHEIKLMSEEEAKEIIDFVSMLLKTIYEYPARAQNVQD